jgi:hypothetical protein
MSNLSATECNESENENSRKNLPTASRGIMHNAGRVKSLRCIVQQESNLAVGSQGKTFWETP